MNIISDPNVGTDETVVSFNKFDDHFKDTRAKRAPTPLPADHKADVFTLPPIRTRLEKIPDPAPVVATPAAPKTARRNTPAVSARVFPPPEMKRSQLIQHLSHHDTFLNGNETVVGWNKFHDHFMEARAKREPAVLPADHIVRVFMLTPLLAPDKAPEQTAAHHNSTGISGLIPTAAYNAIFKRIGLMGPARRSGHKASADQDETRPRTQKEIRLAVNDAVQNALHIAEMMKNYNFIHVHTHPRPWTVRRPDAPNEVAKSQMHLVV